MIINTVFISSYKKYLPITYIFLFFLIINEAFGATTFIKPTCNNIMAIAPYLGIDTNALVTISVYNQDLMLLQQRQKISKVKSGLSKSCPPAVFEVSGMAAGLITVPINNQPTNESITLDSAEIDFASHINDWATTFFDFAYNNQPSIVSGYLGNSNAYLDRVFLTIGNLNQSNLYTTLGRRYVPFGQYFSYMISGSLAETIGKTEATSLLMGYQHSGEKGIYSSTYVIKSVKKILWDSNQKALPGLTLGYNNSAAESFKIDFGVDYIQSLTVAQGIQNTINTAENIPGIDFHTKIDINHFTILSEYIGAITSFNAASFVYNNHGAKPAAINFEIGYEFTLFHNSSSIAIGYGKTYESSQLNLPAQKASVAYNISFSPNVIFGMEYQHNINYSQKTVDGAQPNSFSPPAKNVVLTRLMLYF